MTDSQTTAIKTLEEMRRYRWIGEEAYQLLCEHGRDDMYIQQLIGGLPHCASQEATIHLLIQAVVVMAQANKHMHKIATDALMLQPSRTMIFRKDDLL